MGDIQGPKFRIGLFQQEKVELADGQSFVLDSNNESGTAKRVHLPHKEIFDAVHEGDEILLYNDVIALKCISKS